MGGASGDQEKITVGLDVSDKHVHACFLDHQGTLWRRAAWRPQRLRCAGGSAGQSGIGLSSRLVFIPLG